MRAQDLPFVAIEQLDGEFKALLSVDGLLSMDDDPEVVLRKAAAIYERTIATLRSSLASIRDYRAQRKTTPARLVWRFGDAIFKLIDDLASLSLQLSDLYGHLERDVGARRKWLEKAIIFRRHLPSEKLIPKSLNWGRCEKGTRRAAERLRTGLMPE